MSTVIWNEEQQQTLKSFRNEENIAKYSIILGKTYYLVDKDDLIIYCYTIKEVTGTQIICDDGARISFELFQEAYGDEDEAKGFLYIQYLLPEYKKLKNKIDAYGDLKKDKPHLFI